MTNTPDIHNKSVLDALTLLNLKEQVDHGLQKLTQKHASTTEFLSTYTLVVNPRFKTCAGLTRYKEKQIDLNIALLQQGREKERDETFLHEVAHVAAYHVGKEHGHGSLWKETMLAFGLDAAERCHQYAFLKPTSQRYVYTCKDCGKEIWRARKLHKKGQLWRWYHPPCKNSVHKGRYFFTDTKELES